MSNEAQEWQKLASRLRRAMGLFEPTPEEAAEAMRTAGEVPMSEDEIDEIVRGVCEQRGPKRRDPTSTRSWPESVDTEKMIEDTMVVMNRNAGEDDEAVDREQQRLREEALEDDEEEDEA